MSAGTTAASDVVSKAAVIGGGSFGTALALVLAWNGANVRVWVRKHEQAEAVNAARENQVYLPGVTLPPNLVYTSDVLQAVADVEVVILAIPTQFLRAFLVANRSTLPVGAPLVLCAKGIEMDSLETPYQILADELPGKYAKYIAVLSGPSFAKEIAKKLPTNVTVAAVDPELALRVQRQISNRQCSFRCYTSDDIMGCEIAGAVKNVLAIASGASSGLGLGLNARAGLICRGLAELGVLASAMGSNGKALSGLAGVGDLLLTCSSEMSRNFSVGFRLAKGETLAAIVSSSVSVAEGVASAKSVYQLAKKLSVSMPITEQVYFVLYEGKTVVDALKTLEDRPLGAET